MRRTSPVSSPIRQNSPLSLSKATIINLSSCFVGYNSENYTSGPGFFNVQVDEKQGDFSPNNSFERIEEQSNEEDSFDNTEDFLHSNLLETLKTLTKISDNIRTELNKNNSPNNINNNSQSSIDLVNELKLFPNKNSQKNPSKFNKFTSHLSNSSLPSSQIFGSIRRITVRNMPGTPKKKTSSKVKNLGIYFGHENWNLVLNMIIGIRTSVKSLYSISEEMPVETYEFAMKGHFELIQKRVAGFDMRKTSKFYDYAPNIFERIRKKFGISNEMYLRSIGPENLLGSIIMGNLASLTELMSSGKSGSFFYFTGDCMVCFFKLKYF